MTCPGAGSISASWRCRSRNWTTPTNVSGMPSGIGGRSTSRCTSTVFCCSAAGSTSSGAISMRHASGSNEARDLLDSWPRHSWLQYARLDDHLGSIWRADALADPANAAAKLEQAADLKVPAALAVDSVRHAMTDADARMRWATSVSARILAGAFAVAWDWGNTELVSELVEYHSARGSFQHRAGQSAPLTGPRRRRQRFPSTPSMSSRSSPRGRRRPEAVR